MSSSRAKIEFLLGYSLFFVALWLLWDTPLVYPLKIFVVLLHETSHAAVAVATGGTIQRIELNPMQGGSCYCPGGNAFLTLSAGYLGSFACGGLMFTAARARRVVHRLEDAIAGSPGAAFTAGKKCSRACAAKSIQNLRIHA